MPSFLYISVNFESVQKKRFLIIYWCNNWILKPSPRITYINHVKQNIYLGLTKFCFLVRQKLIQFEKVHPLDPQEDISKSMTNETQASRKDKESQIHSKAIKDWDHIPGLQLQSLQLYRNKSIKHLQDVLKESQSDTPTSVNLGYIDFEDEYDLEVIFQKTLSMLVIYLFLFPMFPIHFPFSSIA